MASKSNTGLYIGLGIGVAVLLLGGVALAMSGGSAPPAAPPPQPLPQPAPQQVAPPPPPQAAPAASSGGGGGLSSLLSEAGPLLSGLLNKTGGAAGAGAGAGGDGDSGPAGNGQPYQTSSGWVYPPHDPNAALGTAANPLVAPTKGAGAF